MSKYIIEFEDEPCYQSNGKNYYQCKEVNIWSANDIALGRMTPLDKALEEAYQKGYDEAKLIYQNPHAESDYQRGLDNAFECIRKLLNLYSPQRRTLFGMDDLYKIIDIFSVSEIIDKLKAYEQQKADEIKVGDEVEAYSGRAIVFATSTDKKGNKFCRYWYPSEDRFDMNKTQNLKKTGRHFPQVEELLEIMKGDMK